MDITITGKRTIAVNGKSGFDLLMTGETARELGIARETVVWLEKTGQLPALKTTNGRRLFLRSDVLRVKREREERKKAVQ